VALRLGCPEPAVCCRATEARLELMMWMMTER
jgi:hypothetical protein